MPSRTSKQLLAAVSLLASSARPSASSIEGMMDWNCVCGLRSRVSENLRRPRWEPHSFGSLGVLKELGKFAESTHSPSASLDALGVFHHISTRVSKR